MVEEGGLKQGVGRDCRGVSGGCWEKTEEVREVRGVEGEVWRDKGRVGTEK